MKTKTLINLIVLLILLVTSFGVMPLTQPSVQAASIVRVKTGGSTSAGCGSSWATACELQTALSNAGTGTEIWVAAGTYRPGTNRADTFQLRSGVALYGGFGGTETAREQRNWETNLSVLSGDIGVQDDSSDNSYHVVNGSGVDTTAILDGFTVSGGNTPLYGGGMYNQYGSSSLANVIFFDNTAAYGGAGMYNENSNPSLTNVTFSGNDAGRGWGGGLSNSGSRPILTNVVFNGNNAYSGAGMYNGGSNPFLTNVIFNRNSAQNLGGGIYNLNSNPYLTNVTFNDNLANNYGGGIYNDYGSNPTIVNSILWGNTVKYRTGSQIYNDDESAPSIRYSDIQGGCSAIPGDVCSGGGNIDNDPLFTRTPHPGFDGIWGTADDDYGDLRQMYGSPVIDAGDNTAPGLAGVSADLAGKPRFYDVPGIKDTGVGPAPVVDMGAYEKHANDVPAAGNNSYFTNEDILLHISAPGILVNDSDPDGETLNAVLESGPSSGSLDLNRDGSFDYQPETNYSGVVTFTYHATDGLLISNTATVSIEVSNVNYAPIAVRDEYTVTEDTSLSINAPGVLGNDGDQNGDQLTAVLVERPSSSSFTFNPDGSFNFLPEKDDNGAEWFYYQASDGLLLSEITQVMILISEVNDIPIANDDTYTTPENTKLIINSPGVLINDRDPDMDPLTAILESGPSSGSLDFNSDGSFEYLPEVDFNGVVTFTYHVSDDLLVSNTASVTITVTSVDAPIANNDTYTTHENTKLTISAPGVLKNDSDPNDDPLNAVLQSKPSSGFLTLNPDGSFDYLPEKDYSGVVTFTYCASDGLLESNHATVFITVSKIERDIYLPVIMR